MWLCWEKKNTAPLNYFSSSSSSFSLSSSLASFSFSPLPFLILSFHPLFVFCLGLLHHPWPFQIYCSPSPSTKKQSKGEGFRSLVGVFIRVDVVGINIPRSLIEALEQLLQIGCAASSYSRSIFSVLGFDICFLFPFSSFDLLCYWNLLGVNVNGFRYMILSFFFFQCF